MPIALEPGQQFSIVLDCDSSKPKEIQPTFFCRSQSMRGQIRISKTLDLLKPEIETEDLFRKTVDAIGDCLIGWKNMGGLEYSKEALFDVLSYSEARELLNKVMFNRHMDLDEKKSSESSL